MGALQYGPWPSRRQRDVAALSPCKRAHHRLGRCASPRVGARPHTSVVLVSWHESGVLCPESELAVPKKNNLRHRRNPGLLVWLSGVQYQRLVRRTRRVRDGGCSSPDRFAWIVLLPFRPECRPLSDSTVKGKKDRSRMPSSGDVWWAKSCILGI